MREHFAIDRHIFTKPRGKGYIRAVLIGAALGCWLADYLARHL